MLKELRHLILKVTKQILQGGYFAHDNVLYHAAKNRGMLTP
jgi:hypothetical protein